MGTGWHDNAAYERAKAKWDEIKAEQNKATQQRQQQQQLLAMVALNEVAETGTPEQRTRALQMMSEALGLDPTTIPAHGQELSDTQLSYWLSRHQKKTQAPAGQTPQTVGDLVTLYLAEQKQRNEARHKLKERQAKGEEVTEPKRATISDSRYGNIVIYAGKLKDIYGADLVIARNKGYPA